MATTKLELIKALNVSTSQFHSRVKDLGLEIKDLYTDEEVAKINGNQQQVRSPKVNVNEDEKAIALKNNKSSQDSLSSFLGADSGILANAQSVGEGIS